MLQKQILLNNPLPSLILSAVNLRHKCSWLNPAEYIKWLRKSGPGSNLEPAQKTHLAKRFSDIELFAITVLPLKKDINI